MEFLYIAALLVSLVSGLVAATCGAVGIYLLITTKDRGASWVYTGTNNALLAIASGLVATYLLGYGL